MRKRLVVIPLCTMLLAGCLPDKIEEEIEQVETENQKNQKVEEQNEENLAPENVELSEEQKEALEETEEITSEEAVNELVDQQESIDVKMPAAKDAFATEQEFSQYVANLFFLYHTEDLKADAFYERIRPHLHDNFLGMLPAEESARLEAFEMLQHTFNQYLSSPIESYELTETVLLERLDEATFYRKYLTEDKEPIYYQTVIRKVNDQWLLFDDSPSPPYEIDPSITNSFKTPGGE